MSSLFPNIINALQEYIANLKSSLQKMHITADTGVQTPDAISITARVQWPAALPYIIQGRKPGKRPPIRAIQSWVGTHLSLPIGSALSLRTAFAIAQTISKKGTKPKNGQSEALNPDGSINTDFMKARINAAVKQDIMQQLTNMP